ncbi:MAG: cytidylyltransferase domain-containing protein [Bacteroidia bacterium]|jgi:spore coat polysaccharide biosynthesis protein SpsF
MTPHLPKIGIITQARMTSTRLPGKILKEVNGIPLLKYHTDRLKQAGFEVIIATTTNDTDNPVCEFAEKNSLKYYRGSEENVLDRFWGAVQKNKIETIVRVTSDCPLIDPHLIRNGIEKYMQLNDPNLYLSNAIERTFARGFDFEIFSARSLEQAISNAKEPSDLEHVTPYIWKNRSGVTSLYHVKQSENHSNLRITVDTDDDFQLVKTLIEEYNADKLPYTEIEKILLEHPELVAINAHIEQKKT